MAGKSHDFTLHQSSYGKEHLVFCILSDQRVFSSKAPDIYNQVMRQTGINGSYVPLMVDPDKIGQAMVSLRTFHIAGASVTVPFKEAVIPFMDSVSESAAIIGAVNTIARNKDKLKGYNTNAIGLMDAFEDIEFDPAGKNALIIGAGGAAKAAAFVLKWLKADKIFVVSQSEARSRQVAIQASGEFLSLEDLLDQTLPVDLLINASTVSSREDSAKYADMAEKLSLSHRCRLILDFNYGRKQNFWQEKAKKNHVQFQDGLLTLIHQARNTLALWTGLEIETDVFKKAMEAAV